MKRMRTTAWLAAAALVSCSGSARNGAGEPGDGSDTAAAPAASAGADSLPAAILGTAPPPRGEAVRYVPGDDATAGYLVTPGGGGPFPAVILIHEWDGLTDRVKQLADELASRGYVALAADLYQGRIGSTMEENRALVTAARANPAALVANLDHAQRFLRAREDVSGRVATMGWCFGGGVALSYAIGGEEHQGTAMFYGSLVTDPDSLAAIDHAIYGTFAAEDDGIPPDQVAAFVEALRGAGVENDVHVYDAVDHGFWLYVERDPDAPGPAADAWRRLLAYLERTLS